MARISHPALFSRTVRSGLITARMSVVDGGVIFQAPLCFDENVVAETGSWPRAIDPTDSDAVEDALCDLYDTLHPSWCERADAERAQATAGRPAPRGFGAQQHTPCPALWAGR